MQDDTPKPEMSRHEASWHEHLAGMRAAEAARKQGGDPQAAEAMAWATASPVRIAGYELRPASQGTLWTLRRLAREFSAWADAIGMPKAAPGEADGSRECIEMGLTMLAFTDSLRVWDLLETERLGELITEAEKLIHRVPLEDYRKLERHFQMQMERIHGLTPEAVPEKKTPETRTGGSPAMPMPPTAEPSPTSNG
jgi:hypothetical protein